MTIQEAINDLRDALTPQYGAGETRSIIRYVFEDFFNVKPHNPSQEEIFKSFLFEDYLTLKKRLLEGEPVQYVVGFAWFYGLKLKINNSVLIPRPETEELVEWILNMSNEQWVMGNAARPLPISHHLLPITNHPLPMKILDIGTGSGCIPVTLKVKNPTLDITAVDISESALITASRNAYRHNALIDFKRIDILNEMDWAQLPDFQVIVSNPPYIPHFEKALMHNNVLDHEPHLALFVNNENPLIFYEKIADFALKHLKKDENNEGGYLFFECNEFNAPEVVDMLKIKGFQDIILKADMSGKDRMVRAYLSYEL
jgi:release factor glutamine methyltransferase